MKKRRIKSKLAGKSGIQSRSSTTKDLHHKRRQLTQEDHTTAKPSLIMRFFVWILSFFISSPQAKNHSEEIKHLKEQIITLETSISKLTKTVNKIQKRSSSTSASTNSVNLASTVSYIPPPPPLNIPPPPPPPPVLKPVQSNKVSSSVPDTKAKIAKQGISLLDLKGVKLKRRNADTENQRQSLQKPIKAAQLVTLKDLQNVKLKKRNHQCEKNKDFQSPKSAPNKIKTLRRTNIIRSPGGTPLVARNNEDTTGDGLTPAFTKALRRKFESIRISPMEKSPTQWRC